MDDETNSSSEEYISPIIPLKARKRSARHKGPAFRSTCLALSNKSLHPLHNVELPSLVEEFSELEQLESINETSLFDELKNKKTINVNNLVNDWIQSYETDKEKAFLKIVQLILDTSGLKGTVTPEIMQIENCDSVLEMPTDAKTAKGMYPIIRKGLIWKSFNTNYVNFLQTLIKSCEDSIIYDDYFMTNLFSCLNVLKHCLWRPLRHSAMLTVLKLTSPLIDMVLEMKQNISEQQYDDPENEIVDKLSKIEKMIKIVVDEVLPFSHRDRVAVIRILTITELYVWMKKYPEFFVNDDNIYFIRVNLNDKLFDVRTECIHVLQWLYECPEHREVSTKLTNIIKTQIANLLLDKKPEMVIQIIGLIRTMVYYKYVSQNDPTIQYIHSLVYSVNQEIGRLAGEFLDMVIVNKLNFNEPRKSMNKKYLISLVDFSINMKLEKINFILIDSLIDTNLFLKNWDSYIELLLKGFNSVHESQDDDKELVLIDMMVYCVEQVSTGVSPVPRDPDAMSKKKYSSSWEKSDDRCNMTKIFIKNLSALLNKFLPSVEKISRLMEIPKYFDTEELSSNFIHVEEDILMLIGVFQNINKTYPERMIMNNFIRALATFSAVDSSLQNECSALQMDLVQVCLEIFVKIANEHFVDVTSSGNDASQNSQNSRDIVNALMVLSVIFENYDLNKCDVMEKIFPYILFCLKDSSCVHMAFIYALRCSYYSLVWRVTETLQLDPSDRHESLLSLQQLFKKCIDIYESVITYSTISQARVEAFHLICNSLIFQSKSFSNNPDFDSSMYKPTLKTCKALNLFVQLTVFSIEDEETDENRKEKRTLLASYCKLIANSTISVKMAVHIIQHYNIWLSEYGDIIKYMMNVVLDRNKNNAFIVTNICLRSLFLHMKETYGEVITSGNQFLQLKDLANNLALLLPSNVQTKECILKMLRNAIAFSFDGWNRSENENLGTLGVLSPPPNLHFLGILIEFIKKLNRNDKQHIIKFLDHFVQNDVTNLEGNEWVSFTQFRAQLHC